MLVILVCRNIPGLCRKVISYLCLRRLFFSSCALLAVVLLFFVVDQEKPESSDSFPILIPVSKLMETKPSVQQCLLQSTMLSGHLHKAPEAPPVHKGPQPPLTLLPSINPSCHPSSHPSSDLSSCFLIIYILCPPHCKASLGLLKTKILLLLFWIFNDWSHDRDRWMWVGWCHSSYQQVKLPSLLSCFQDWIESHWTQCAVYVKVTWTLRMECKSLLTIRCIWHIIANSIFSVDTRGEGSAS